jgi:hypothetical protein
MTSVSVVHFMLKSELKTEYVGVFCMIVEKYSVITY